MNSKPSLADSLAATGPAHPRRSTPLGLAALGPLLALALQVFSLLLPGRGQAMTLVDWNDVSVGQLRSTFLAVERPVELTVSALATFDEASWRPIAYPWILDARTRKVRWTADPDGAARVHKRHGALRVEVRRDTLELAPGHYEVYFASFGHDYADLPRIVRLMTKLGLYDDWRLHISCDDADVDAVQVGHRARPEFAPLLRIAHAGPNVYEYELFRLDAPTKVLIYAIGEYDRDHHAFVDGGWIADANTRQPVWEMTGRNTRPAGGARKNRLFRDFVDLDAGTYLLGYSSDDTHSFGDWNLNPPIDPEFWGIALFDPRGDATPQFTSPVEDPFRSTVLVELDRRRDSSFAMVGLRAKEPLAIRVIALGEYDDDTERFYDFGWIERARTHERVWEMNKYNTRPAGGAEKNRMADETLSLDPGEYLIGYVTDDSHAFGSWNAAPPRFPHLWGIRVSALGESFDRERIEAFDPADDPQVLVDLTALGDDVHVTDVFTLPEATTVRILAVGEGLRGHMFDYGYLRRLDERSRKGVVVWSMEYRDTAHAGGADKNRRVSETLDLPAGRYEAHFVTDDSHSFEDWNDAPPDAPHLWGLTIARIGE